MNKLVSLTLALALFTVTACAPTPSTVPSTRPPSHQPPTPIPTKIAVAAPTDTPTNVEVLSNDWQIGRQAHRDHRRQ